MSRSSLPPRIIVYDGACRFCSAWVRFLLRRDPRGLFRFAPMQGAYGSRLLVAQGQDPADPATFLYLENSRPYTDSVAVIRVLGQLGGAWPLVWLLWLIPAFLRDPAYRLVARNRYRWFGRKDRCELPEPGMAERFID
ncbi:hypothetical protein C3942_00945 [Solimonas fluminis]|uniref:Thiol-disulfide oxidoreductase n=1 Tax=Solimonas fluminis TaxID=2086571 RepID=A0A2S5TKK1_9GAMM|nr:thiol-disulfide oxidoreductase DCC family protein [Solimonas fluminis]PPE75491.1 hypothetical protein C3942_00945 [Solimonas fluminis]